MVSGRDEVEVSASSSWVGTLAPVLFFLPLTVVQSLRDRPPLPLLLAVATVVVAAAVWTEVLRRRRARLRIDDTGLTYTMPGHRRTWLWGEIAAVRVDWTDASIWRTGPLPEVVGRDGGRWRSRVLGRLGQPRWGEERAEVTAVLGRQTARHGVSLEIHDPDSDDRPR